VAFVAAVDTATPAVLETNRADDDRDVPTVSLDVVPARFWEYGRAVVVPPSKPIVYGIAMVSEIRDEMLAPQICWRSLYCCDFHRTVYCNVERSGTSNFHSIGIGTDVPDYCIPSSVGIHGCTSNRTHNWRRCQCRRFFVAFWGHLLCKQKAVRYQVILPSEKIGR